MPQELGDIIRIESERERELQSLKSKTSSYKIEGLTRQAAAVKHRIGFLGNKGFYEHYLEINRLNSELSKLESRIDALKMREASGADVDVLVKVEKMEKKFTVLYKLFLLQL